MLAREKRVETEDFKVDATGTPHVHLEVIETVRNEALWRPVPSGANVLGERALSVNVFAAAKVC